MHSHFEAHSVDPSGLDRLRLHLNAVHDFPGIRLPVDGSFAIYNSVVHHQDQEGPERQEAKPLRADQGHVAHGGDTLQFKDQSGVRSVK